MSVSRIELVSKVGPDGILHLDIPVAPSGANADVRVLVESMDGKELKVREPLSREEWLAFIERTAGKWQGEFERPEQLELEERNPL